jgi:hypothetical protein
MERVHMGEKQKAHGEHLEQAVACPQCQAINPHGGVTCGECGAVLEAPRATRESKEERAERRDERRAVRRGCRRMTTVTWLYRAGALAYAAAMLVAVLALVRPEVPRTGGVLVVGLTTVLAVLMLVGAIQVPFRPFVWTVIIASLATVVALVHLVGPDPLGLMFFFTGGWAAVLWATLPSAAGFRRLIAEHTDEYVLQHASVRTRRSIRGRSGQVRHERLLAAMRRAAGRAWKISAAAALLLSLASIVGTLAVLSRLRPQEFSARLESFETVWNRGYPVAVGGLFPPAVKEQKTAWLERVAEGHGWGDSLPQLGEGRMDHTADRASVHYQLADLALTVDWKLDGRDWQLVRLELPDPPLDPALERFLAAWQSSDLKAIAAFFPAGYEERTEESLVRASANRNWDVLPEVLETETGDSPEGEVVVTLRLEEGEVTTKWLFRLDGSWRLQALQLPPR